ncbi:MAG: hypothetical protein HYZ34_03730 [Ignavibacteriae bacterium]|nr:hypothetical protein [Ignavibacteriota bacterium]
MISDNLLVIMEMLDILQRQALSSVDDWIDLIGDEIKNTTIFTRQFEELKAEYENEKSEMSEKYQIEFNSYQLEVEKDNLESLKDKAESLKDKMAAEKIIKELEKKFNEELGQRKIEYEKKLNDLISKTNSKLPLCGTSVTPIFTSGSVPAHLDVVNSGRPEANFLIPQQFNESMGLLSQMLYKLTCPFCNSTQTETSKNNSYMRHCKSCGRDYSPPIR